MPSEIHDFEFKRTNFSATSIMVGMVVSPLTTALVFLIIGAPPVAINSLQAGRQTSKPAAKANPEFRAANDLFKKFLRQPGTLTVNVQFKIGPQAPFHSGSGVLTFSPNHARPIPMKWDMKAEAFDYHFVAGADASLEWSHVTGHYDRHLVRDGFPYARLSLYDTAGFPTILAAEDIRALLKEGVTVVTKSPAGYLLAADVKTQAGELHAKLTLDPDGRPLKINYDELSSKGRITYELAFSDYRFSSSPAVYDTRPQLGLTTLQQPESIDVLSTNAPMPKIELQGRHGKTSLAELAKKGFKLLVFTEKSLPVAFERTLSRLNTSATAEIISTEPIRSRLPVFIATQNGFDTAGIAATPQIYLTHDGRLLQAWIGWDETKADQFVREVKKAATETP